MASRIESIRAAVERGKELSAEFRTGTATFYEQGNTTPLFTLDCRVKKPKAAAFDAGNQTTWATKRELILKVPLEIPGVTVIKKGLVVQISTPDGDPTINHINFVAQSSLVSQFAAEREVNLVTEVSETPRIS